MIALAQQLHSSLPVDEVVHGDALLVLRSLPGNSVDAIVSDPPSGILFMGATWDSNRGGRVQWVAWMTEIMSEALRCLKPGGYGLIWALPRTSHWTALALEDAGFIVKDCVSHIFGSGFPKSMDISKAIDRMAGAEREVIGSRIRPDGTREIDAIGRKGFHEGWDRPWRHDEESIARKCSVTAPATPEAQQWNGYGTALKPSTEFWWLVQKPISEKTIAANVLKWGTGGLNIASTRVASGQDYQDMARENDHRFGGVSSFPSGKTKPGFKPAQGRFPSHLLLSHSVWCVPRGVKRVRGGGGPANITGSPTLKNVYSGYDQRSLINHRDPDGMEEVEDYECHESCPIRLLDEQSGIRKTSQPGTSARVPKFSGKVYNASITPQKEWGYGDTGGASRYFQTFHYFSKASRAERNRGLPAKVDGALLDAFDEGFTAQESGAPMNSRCANCGRLKLDYETSKCKCAVHMPMEQVSRHGVQNNHPTVKSLSLMSWLCRLITPPDGIILDPFLGSGSTAVAAIHEGFHFIGIEQEQEYVAICEARIAHALNGGER